jgi:hypothetical protein
MSDVVTAVPRAEVTPRPIDEWVQIIRADFRRSVEGIIAAGRHLQEAKAEVDHGEWLPLLHRLKISGVGNGIRWAQMLMTIAENEVLANPNHWFALPTSWRTLYELTKLPPETLEAKIADGTIAPDITREEVSALCPPVERSTPSVEETPPPDRRDRRKRVPHTALITSWDQVEKFRDTVRHNLDVKFRRGERWGQDPEDRNHELTVAAMIMVSPDDVQELDRYVELHTGTSRRELMEEAVAVLCSGLRGLRQEQERRIEREQRQKYEAAMAEKRAREARGEAGAAT